MDKKVTKRLDKFKKEKNVPKLLTRLEKGMYNERIAVLEILGNMEANSTIPAIEKTIDDTIEIVSQKAMTTLELLNIDSSIKEKITNKRDYWINLENQKKRQKENIRISKEEASKRKNNKGNLDFSQNNRERVGSTRISNQSKAGIGIAAGVFIIIKIILLIIKHSAG